MEENMEKEILQATRLREHEVRIDYLHDISLWAELKPEEQAELTRIEAEYSQIIAEEVRLAKQSKRQSIKRDAE